jgi:hypothetical protein
MEKTIIHNITIATKLEKSLFQIVLPENAEAIIGIAVICDLLIADEDIQISEAGVLRLFVADTGDKFFSESVNSISAFPKYQFTGNKFALDNSIVPAKKCSEWMETYQPAQGTLIEGAYEDYAGVKFHGTFSYNVKIYLRVKMTQP